MFVKNLYSTQINSSYTNPQFTVNMFKYAFDSEFFDKKRLIYVFNRNQVEFLTFGWIIKVREKGIKFQNEIIFFLIHLLWSIMNMIIFCCKKKFWLGGRGGSFQFVNL